MIYLFNIYYTIVFKKIVALYNLFQHDEKRKSTIIKELNRLQGAMLRITKKVVELENERKTLQMETQGEHKKVDLLKTLLTKENKLLEEKKEILYQTDFNLQKCEMKLERVRGIERDKTEVEKKQARIEELQIILKEKTATSKLLQSQIVSLEVKPITFCIKKKKLNKKNKIGQVKFDRRKYSPWFFFICSMI